LLSLANRKVKARIKLHEIGNNNQSHPTSQSQFKLTCDTEKIERIKLAEHCERVSS